MFSAYRERCACIWGRKLRVFKRKTLRDRAYLALVALVLIGQRVSSTDCGHWSLSLLLSRWLPLLVELLWKWPAISCMVFFGFVCQSLRQSFPLRRRGCNIALLRTNLTPWDQAILEIWGLQVGPSYGFRYTPGDARASSFIILRLEQNFEQIYQHSVISKV